MDSTVIGQSSFGYGAIEDVLASALIKRYERFDTGKQKGFGMKLPMILSQQSHQVIAQKRRTLAPALRRRDQQAMANAVQVLDPNVGGLRKTQAAP